MNENTIRSYLNGLMNMASSLSKSIGPSYIIVDCYKKEELEKLKKDYHIKKITPSTLSFKEKLGEWFLEERITIESILYWSERKIKEERNIYDIEREDFEKMEKYTPFYIIDDAFILETDKYLILYILGNNE